MIRRLIILLLIVGCGTEPEEIVGCIDSLACNFDEEANNFDDNCIYPENNYDCLGNKLDECGIPNGNGYNQYGCCDLTQPDELGICDGYLDKVSYFPNENAQLFLHSILSDSSLEIPIATIDGIEMGFIIANVFPQKIENINVWGNGYGYIVSSVFTIPNLPSGLYLIADKIPFIIKSSSNVDALVVYPSNTINAYNRSGGASFYTDPKANVLSFLRPQSNYYHSSFSIPFFKWIRSLNYNFSYIADIDLDDENIFNTSKLIIIPGHNEYWSRKARKNFDEFISAENDAIILSGNTMWWQIRYEENHQIVCYKSIILDPIDDPFLKTTNWFKSILEYPILNSIGVDFRYGGYGDKEDQGWDGFKIINPLSPLFDGIEIELNQIISVPTREYDGTPISAIQNGNPIIDNDLLNFHKIEIIGYDIGIKWGTTNENSYPLFLIFQKTPTSGYVINTSSTDWCYKGFLGQDSDIIKQITINAIDLLLMNKNIFSEDLP